MHPPAAKLKRERTADVDAPPIVGIVRREGLLSVFASQVMNRMARIGECGFPVEIGVFTPVGQWVRPALRERWQTMVRGAPAVLQGRVWRLPSFPSRIDLPMAEARVLSWWLRSRYGRRRGPLVVQCRNATVTSMALEARRRMPHLRVVFDFRGVQDHEWLYKQGLTFETAPDPLLREARAISELQRRGVREADAVFCVSDAMVDYLVKEYGIDREKCLVVPCCVDVARFAAESGRRAEMRARLGLVDRFVVTYCGSVENYQLPRQSLELFRRIRKMEPRAHFLAVTTDAAVMQSVAKEAGVDSDQLTVVSVRHSEVPAYLGAADVGLLLRERCAVNQVASPVKFGEYLASGTPVILSEGIGDYSDLTGRQRFGVVLPAKGSAADLDADAPLRQFIADYRGSIDEWRLRCRRAAAERLDFAHYLPGMSAVYRRLTSSAPMQEAHAAC